jgi:major type 1 subunit fimbrin (pilin)
VIENMGIKFKTLSSAVLVAAAFSSSAFAAGASDSTVSGGTIHFTGEVVDAACSVSQQTDGIESPVALGQVKMDSLKTAGATANQTPFNIVLDDCDTSTYKNASVSFTGTATTEGDALAVSSITTPGVAATGVGIQIIDGSSTVVTPNGGDSAAVGLTDGTNTLPFTAQFYSANGTVTAGAADADATFSVNYS